MNTEAQVRFDAPGGSALARLLAVIAEYELWGDVWWNCDLQFYVHCNDLFAWGCADTEPIGTLTDVELLDQACKDAPNDGALLYCARRRHMRPQGAYYEHFDAAARPLFDECGSFRPAQPGNPVASGSPEEEEGKEGK